MTKSDDYIERRWQHRPPRVQWRRAAWLLFEQLVDASVSVALPRKDPDGAGVNQLVCTWYASDGAQAAEQHEP